MSAALALAFTGCKDDTSDLGIMQKNEAPTVVASDGVATAFLIGQTLDLNSYQNVNLPILDVAMNKDFPESATLAGTLQIANNEDFNNAIDIPYTAEAAAATQADDAVENATRKFKTAVEGNAVENAFVELFGKDPAAKECYLRYNMFIQDGTQANILMYEGNEWWPSHTVTVTPVDLKLDIAREYTVFGPGIGNGTPAEGIQMMHGEKHQYDDPVFKAVVEVPEDNVAGFTISICPTDNPSKVYGVAEGYDAAASSGRLAIGGTPIKFTQFGPYQIEVNMETLMYTITSAYTQLWIPCSGCNWNFQRSCQTILTSDYVNYAGFAYIEGVWAFATQGNVQGANFVKTDVENTTDGNITKGTMQISADKRLNNDNGIAQPGKRRGLYWLDANIVKMTWTATYIQTLGVVGTVNNWGNENEDKTVTPDIALKPVTKNPTAYSIWEGDVTFNEPGEWKIRANNDWGINIGGDPSNLTKDGGNLKVEKAGTYHIVLNVSAHPWTITVTKK